MTNRHRNRALACLAAAALAIGAALAQVGWRVFEVLRHTLETFSGERGEPIPALDLTASLLSLAAGALLIGALGFGLAAWRAALALGRASLIESDA
ncbi:MAG TPA: hypothetical protein VII78_13360 [Myxococcota bacterium]|jgi:hypothetical protein